MKRIARWLGAGLAVAACLWAESFAQVTNPMTRAAIGGIPDCKDTRVFCVGKQTGAEHATICAMATPETEATQCAAGSAIKAAKDSGLCAVGTPCLVAVGPGVFAEAVAIDAIQGLHLRGSGVYETIIRPTVANDPNGNDDVGGGALRIANSDPNADATRWIEVSNLTAWNDAWSPPESGLHVGRETGPTATATRANWTDIYIHDVRCIGAHDGCQFFGSELSTDDSPPRLYLDNVMAISGADPWAVKGFIDLYATNLSGLGQTNWCESESATWLAAVSGVAQASSDIGTLVLEVADRPGYDGAYSRRQVTITDADGGGGNECGPGNSAVGIYNTVALYTESAGSLAISSDTGDGDFANGTGGVSACAYTIDAVTHNNGEAYTASDVVDSPCTDRDWGIISSPGSWKLDVWHFGVANTTPTTSPDNAVTRINGLTGRVYANDVTTAIGSSCSGAQTFVGGILAYTSTWQAAQISNVDIEVNINHPLLRTNTCATAIGGMAIHGATRTDAPFEVNGRFVVNNRGDILHNVYGLANASTNATSLRGHDLYIDINNTAGGYAGTSKTLHQASSGTLTVGSVTSPDAITTSGTIAFVPSAFTAQDSLFTIADEADLTKKAQFQASGITTATTRTYTLPDASVNVVGSATTVTEVAGRSLSVSGSTLQADAELYTETKCLNVDPSAATTDWLFWRTDQALTITGLDCIVDAATSVVLTPRECDANGANCSDIEAAVTCAATNTTEGGGSIDNTTIDAGDYIRVTRGTKTGSPTQAVICLTYTVND